MKLRNSSEAISAIMNHYLADDELLYFDGANWYIKTGEETVTVYTTGDMENVEKFFMVGERAKAYINNNVAKSSELFAKYIKYYRESIVGAL